MRITGFLFVLLIATTLFATVPTIANEGWTRVGGNADAVATGNNGSLWKLGTDTYNSDNPNHSINKYVNNNWKQVSGWGVKLTVDESGNAWGIDSANELFRYEGDKPVVVQKAIDVEADNLGRIWVVNEEGQIRFVDPAQSYRFVPFKKASPHRVKAVAAVRIGQDDFPMVIDDKGNSHLFDGMKWLNQSKQLVDLTVGADGVLWAVDAQNQIWKCELVDHPFAAEIAPVKWVKGQWTQVKGKAIHISAGKEVYVTDADGHFYVPETSPLAPSPSAANPSNGQPAGTKPFRGIVDNSKWMGQNHVLLENRKLSETILCHSHNSGSYSIDADSDFSIADISGKVFLSHLVKTLSSLKKQREKTAALAKCQSQNISQQLSGGIRHFDLRLFINKDGEYQSAHTMWGAEFNEMFAQMNQFLNAPEHEKEVIVLQVKGFRDERRSNRSTANGGEYDNKFTDKDNNDFLQYVKSRFGDKLYQGKIFGDPSEWSDVSFGTMWKAKAQVILTKFPKEYPSVGVVNGEKRDWCPKTTKVNFENLESYPSVFFAKSPDTEMVIGTAFSGLTGIPSSIERIADDVAPVVFSWMVDPNYASPFNSGPPRLASGKPVNLFSADFYEKMPLLDLAHYLNGLGDTNYHLNKARSFAKPYTNWNNWAWCNGDKIIVYEHNNRVGKSLVLGEGDHDSSALGDLNNKISSISIPARLTVTVLGNDGVGGGRRVLTETIDDLSAPRHNFNDRISSIKVKRTIASAAQKAEFFEQSDQKGNALKLGPGEYNADFLISKGFNDKISSIRVPARFRVTLFRNENFKRILVRSYHQGNHNLPRTANDEASSIRVTAIGIPK